MALVSHIFPNFASALAACGSGYNDSDIADVVAFATAHPIDKTLFATESAIKTVLSIGIAAAEITKRPLTVLDLGGGCGTHYFRVAAAIRTPMRWAIVETPTMAKRAASLSNGRFDVFSDLDDAIAAVAQVDVVCAISSVQYVPEPLVTLQKLAALKARYFILGRFPWWAGDQFVGVQVSPLSSNGDGPMTPKIADRDVRYPITFANRDAVLRILDQYEIVFVFGSPGPAWNWHAGEQQIPEVSIVFRSKES